MPVALAVIDVTSCRGLCQSDIQYRVSTKKTGFLRFLSPDEKHIYLLSGVHVAIWCWCCVGTALYFTAERVYMEIVFRDLCGKLGTLAQRYLTTKSEAKSGIQGGLKRFGTCSAATEFIRCC